jgi:MFS family permease
MSNSIAIQINHATKTVASTMGILLGLAGIDHGIFEILQGNTPANDMMIAAIGPGQRFWQYGKETALTVVPNFLATGILAVIFGILVMVWSIKFIEKKYSAGILFLLGVILFLFGGGFAPIFMTIIASLTATRIYKPLKFWRAALPGFLRRFLGKLWLLVLVTFVTIFIFSVVVAIFGWPLTVFYDADTTFDILNNLSFIMLGFMLLASITGFAHDIQTQIERETN